jgi:uncharacterized membrane protein
MKKNKILFLSRAAIIAAIYVILTLSANAFGLANYPIQVRFSEALTILPFFTASAIPGLFVGCLLSNFLTGCLFLDIIFGSAATLIGALGTYALRKFIGRHKWIAPIPPIVANTLIIPPILAYVYQYEGSLLYFALTVGAGEIISCGLLGMLLFNYLQKTKLRIFN